MATEISELTGGADEFAGGLRDERLPSVTGRADAGRAADVEPEVGAALECRLTRVQAHAHAHRGARRPGLGRQHRLRGSRRRNRIARTLKGGEVLIGTAVDLMAASLRDGRPDQPPQLMEHRAIAVSELLQEPRRPLDVREEQGDGPGR